MPFQAPALVGVQMKGGPCRLSILKVVNTPDVDGMLLKRSMMRPHSGLRTRLLEILARSISHPSENQGSHLVTQLRNFCITPYVAQSTANNRTRAVDGRMTSPRPRHPEEDQGGEEGFAGLRVFAVLRNTKLRCVVLPALSVILA